MKLIESQPYLETSGQMDERFFSIQDTGMIFDILRNKMYSNPILAIAREISCNARDAHREVGKGDVPIEITLPTALSPEYRVKDFGPGISPDRMYNIFIKYTASSKRGDNVQTGGFGLGAKTPFSYSDTFSIITVNGGIKYLYNCVIDETKVGKIMLAHQEETDLPSGTEIIIPVLSKNFREFATWTEDACQHWEVRPIIRGSTIDWADFQPVIGTDEWFFSGDLTSYLLQVIVDGVRYKIGFDTLSKYFDINQLYKYNKDLFIHFQVGELTLSANREQIYLDETTQQKICVRLKKIVNELTKQINLKIANLPNFWEAVLFYHKDLPELLGDTSFLGDLFWNGIKIENIEYKNLGCQIVVFHKGKYSRRRHFSSKEKVWKSVSQFLSLRERNSSLFINDLDSEDFSTRNVSKIFADNPELKLIQIICPTDKVTVDSLNDLVHLDQMNVQMLSSAIKLPNKRVAQSSRLIVFKFDQSSATFKNVAFESIKNDPNQKVYCLLDKAGRNSKNRSPIIDDKYVNLNELQSFIKDHSPKLSIYGIDADNSSNKAPEAFNDLQSLGDFLNKKVFDQNMDDMIFYKLSRNDKYDFDSRYADKKILSKIKDSNSLYLKRAGLEKSLEKISDHKRSIFYLYYRLNGEITQQMISNFITNNPDRNLKKIGEDFEKQYPLLSMIQSYLFDSNTEKIVDYINLMDQIKLEEPVLSKAS